MNTQLSAQKYSLSAAAKFFAVLTGAVLTGFLWRVRGDHGFGGMWGMFAVASGLVLLIFALFGERKKMSYGMLPVCVLAMAVTAGGWGTVNTQMAGVLRSSEAFFATGEEAVISISPYSGLFIMLCLGFGWMPLFAALLGSLFSEKRYSFASYAALAAVFVISALLFKATLSHIVLKLVTPQAVTMFNDGLADRELKLTAYKAYMSHFSSDAWAKKIPGGRNYFTSIEIISNAAAAALTLVWQRFALKDKAASLIAFATNAVAAVAISAADVFLVIGFEYNIFHILRTPGWVASCRWSLWEFFTGFLIGLGIMLILVSLPKKIVAGNAEIENGVSLPSNRVFLLLYHGILTLFFTLGLTGCVALGARISEQLEARFGELKGFFGENAEILITAAACIIMLMIFMPIAYKNCFRRRLPVPVPVNVSRFSKIALPAFFAFCSLIYFLTGEAYLLKVKWIKITPPTLFKALMEGWDSITFIMLGAAIVFYVSYFALTRLTRKRISRR